MHFLIRNQYELSSKKPLLKRMECHLNFITVVALSIVWYSAFVQLVYADFSQLFKPNWAPDHIVIQGDNILLTLDNTTGCGFESRSKYLFGIASLQVKLIEGDSAGVVTAFYMSSEGPNHDELDFEFLGNVSGVPYLVQTDVYVNGSGNREQRHTLWFDPTTDFHTYSFFWNHRSIISQNALSPVIVHASTLEQVPYCPAAGDWVRLKREDKKHSPVGIVHLIHHDGAVGVAFIGLDTLWKGGAFIK